MEGAGLTSSEEDSLEASLLSLEAEELLDGGATEELLAGGVLLEEAGAWLLLAGGTLEEEPEELAEPEPLPEINCRSLMT